MNHNDESMTGIDNGIMDAVKRQKDAADKAAADEARARESMGPIERAFKRENEGKR